MFLLILAMYSPITPIEISCTPPINIELIIREVHPVMVCFKKKCEKMAYKIITKDNPEIIKPNRETYSKGLSEKPVIPSKQISTFYLTDNPICHTFFYLG